MLIAAFIILKYSLDGMIKSAIVENTSDLMQTQVNVESVSISLFDGAGEIYGFSISNPEGFSEAEAVRVDEIFVELDLFSILSDTIVVENVRIQNPQLYFEQRGLGINLRKLNQNMDETEEVDESLLVIDRLIIENGVVKVSSTIDRERTAEAEIDEFELTEIGREGNNTVKQSIRQILDPLLEQAVREALSGGLLEQLENKIQDLLGNDEGNN